MPGGPTGASVRSAASRPAASAQSYSGSSGRSPEVWVSSCRTVMPWRAAAVKSGRYAPTFASMPRVPRSICCTAATAVNSLVRDARSKGVPTVIGTRSSGGSSTPASVASS
ncbi:hypothetical protein SVIOM74S_03672 [Streptomyces violarus]